MIAGEESIPVDGVGLSEAYREALGAFTSDLRALQKACRMEPREIEHIEPEKLTGMRVAVCFVGSSMETLPRKDHTKPLKDAEIRQIHNRMERRARTALERALAGKAKLEIKEFCVCEDYISDVETTQVQWLVKVREAVDRREIDKAVSWYRSKIYDLDDYLKRRSDAMAARATAEQNLDNAERSVELRMREAMASGGLEPLVRCPITGQPLKPEPRWKWLWKEDSLDSHDRHEGLQVRGEVSGFHTNFVGNASVPGPNTIADGVRRSVFFIRSAFDDWVQGREARPSDNVNVPTRPGYEDCQEHDPRKPFEDLCHDGRLLEGPNLDTAIKRAIRIAIAQRTEDIKGGLVEGNRPLHGEEQVKRAMAILRKHGIGSKNGGLQEQVRKIANNDTEFTRARGLVGVRRT